MAVPITARAPLEFTPPTLPNHLTVAAPTQDDPGRRIPRPDPADADKHELRILVRVPTMIERDSYSAALIRAGVISYTRQQIRDLALAGVQWNRNPDKVDEGTALLTEYWAVTDEERDVSVKQGEKLRELYEKAAAAGSEPPAPEAITKELAEIRPSVVMDVQRRTRAQALNQEIMASYPPLREALAALTDQDAKRSYLNAEIYVSGWTGLEHTADGNGRGGLQTHEVIYLREQIGQEAFEEISDFVTAMQGIDEDEEKNLVSLLANMSAPIGSIQKESSASSEPGTSTAGPSTATPDAGSPKTTGSSSNSTKRSRTKTARSSARTPTAGHSSTNRSS